MYQYLHRIASTLSTALQSAALTRASLTAPPTTALELLHSCHCIISCQYIPASVAVQLLAIVMHRLHLLLQHQLHTPLITDKQQYEFSLLFFSLRFLFVFFCQ
ncbi:Hypothetical predicted protein [Octopus vulgaris]|uniref:Uncharacterized protein n=1 Tax=Octopus vulgaris TaxID=6645 RepID=A0AA36FLB2_OCTVU|nr:Hypothetical predicted protein [Octopus vulgaris]